MEHHDELNHPTGPGRTTPHKSSHSASETSYGHQMSGQVGNGSNQSAQHTARRSTGVRSSDKLPACRFMVLSTTSRRRMPYLDDPDPLPDLQGVPKRLSMEAGLELNQCLEWLYSNLEPEGEDNKREEICVRLKHDIQSKWPELDCQLHLFGSSKNGLVNNDSDVDICMTAPFVVVPCQLASIFASRKYQNVKCIHAKVPIVRIKDPVSGLHCDINVNNDVGLKNTELVRTFMVIDVRAQKLAKLVKHWASRRVINEAPGGTISSYTWTLMVIHFLQVTDPPVLPKIDTYDSENVQRDDFTKEQENYTGFSTNTEDIGQLMYGFFYHYGKSFNFERNVISVREGKPIRKIDKGWNMGTNQDICVEEPFNITRNLGNGVDSYAWNGLQREIMTGLEKLATGCDFEKEVCRKYEFPTQSSTPDRSRASTVDFPTTEQQNMPGSYQDPGIINPGGNPGRLYPNPNFRPMPTIWTPQLTYSPNFMPIPQAWRYSSSGSKPVSSTPVLNFGSIPMYQSTSIPIVNQQQQGFMPRRDFQRGHRASTRSQSSPARSKSTGPAAIHTPPGIAVPFTQFSQLPPNIYGQPHFNPQSGTWTQLPIAYSQNFPQPVRRDYVGYRIEEPQLMRQGMMLNEVPQGMIFGPQLEESRAEATAALQSDVPMILNGSGNPNSSTFLGNQPGPAQTLYYDEAQPNNTDPTDSTHDFTNHNSDAAARTSHGNALFSYKPSEGWQLPLSAAARDRAASTNDVTERNGYGNAPPPAQASSGGPLDSPARWTGIPSASHTRTYNGQLHDLPIAESRSNQSSQVAVNYKSNPWQTVSKKGSRKSKPSKGLKDDKTGEPFPSDIAARKGG